MSLRKGEHECIESDIIGILHCGNVGKCFHAKPEKEAGMAELQVEGDELVMRLSGLEKAESLHGDLRAPLSMVKGVEVLDDAVHAVHGLRAPGTRLPGYMAVGTFHSKGSSAFAVVHHDTPRGVRVRLEGTGYDDWIVGCVDPEAVAATISVPGYPG